jgi:hypothetical protein
VHENILLFKGFLGPTLKDNDALQSVGMRAARAAGVIVDSAGKLRCPPGTPNANQFTDMQMSNCLVPSAETLAAQAANAVQRFVDGFKFKKGRLAKHKVDQKPANLGIPDADGSNVPVGAFDNSLGITNVEDAISAVANGADLSQIPDEFLIDAIYDNRIPYDAEGSDKRFQVMGTGGGAHGMTRFRDTKTGQLLGVKYAGTPSDAKELASEVLAASVLEEFGYPAMSMRAVKGGNGSMGIVTELIHNKYEGEIDHDYETQKATVDSLIHALLFDLVIANDDRHYGNYLLVDNGDNITIAPIDHGMAIMDQGGSIFDENGKVTTYSFLLHRSNPFMTGLFNFFGERPREKKDRAELIQAIEKSLADIREIDADALGEKLKNILKEISNGHPQPQIKERLDLMASRPDDDPRDYGQGSHTISDIDALVGRIKELQSKSATEIADAFFPDRDYTPQDPVSQLDGFALDLDIPTPDLADNEVLSEFSEDTAGVDPLAKAGQGAPLFSAREAEGLIGVTFDPQEFDDQVVEKLDSFIAEHVPDQLGDLTERDLDTIEKGIGLAPTERDMATQVDDAITFLSNPENGIRGLLLKNLENAVDEQDKEYAQQLIATIDEITEKLKTPEGREEVRARLIKNYAQILNGVDDIQKKYPHLKGKFSVSIEKTPDARSWHAGFAGHHWKDDGTVEMYIQVTPLSLVIENLQSGESVQDGDMLAKTARIEGTDSYQLTLAVHEMIHIAHYDQMAKGLGFEIGNNAPPLMDQLETAGPNLGDTYIGFMYAIKNGLDPNTPISDIKAEPYRKDGSFSHATQFSMFVSDLLIQGRRDKFGDNLAKTLQHLFPASKFGGTEKQKSFVLLMQTLETGSWPRTGGRLQPENLQTTEDIERELSGLLGQDFAEFTNEFKTAISEMLGVDMTQLHTSGISPEEIQSVLGISSQYGGTDIMESVAEAATLNYLVDSFNGSRIIDQTQINKSKEMLDKIIPTAPEKAKQKAITAEAKKMIDKLVGAIEKLPEFEASNERVV